MGHVCFEKHKGLRHDDDVSGAQFRFNLKDRIVLFRAHQALQLVLKRVVVLLNSPEHFPTVLVK